MVDRSTFAECASAKWGDADFHFSRREKDRRA